MAQPPYFLKGLLFNVEQAVVDTNRAMHGMTDKEVETVYDQMMRFYKELTRKPEALEPFAPPGSRKETLIQAIFTAIDQREEVGLDDIYIDTDDGEKGEFPTLEHLYVQGFKRLLKSARFWRKTQGPKGYLNYIDNFLP